MAFVVSVCFMFGCATSPEPANQEARLMPAGYSESTAPAEPAPQPAAFKVCEPRVVEQRAVMNDSCLNVVTHTPAAGKTYNAVGREKKELRNLCENMSLPRCR